MRRIRLACIECDTEECDGIDAIPDDWHDVDEFQSFEESIREVPAAELTDKQQKEMLDWIMGLPQLYNKKARGHHKQRDNAHLWIEHANHYKIANYEALITWWNTLRTRYTRVQKDMSKSGSGER